MNRGLCLLSALALLAAPAWAEARQLPGRADVERAVNAWFSWTTCGAGRDCRGVPRFHRRLTSNRCYRLPPGDGEPGRILCVFSGVDTIGRRPPRRFRNDC